MSLNLASLLRSSAQKNPQADCISIGDKTLSYGVVHAMAQKFAGALEALGVEPGAHIALMLPNVPQFTVAYYGGHYNANPIVPLNVLLVADEVAYHLEDSQAVALVVWEGFLDNGKAGFDRTPGCKHLIVCKADPTDMEAPDGAINMMAALGAAEPMRETAPTTPQDTAVILYTSGTTGRPKGAELTHFNMFYNAVYTATRLLTAVEAPTALVALPLFHSFGQTCMQNATLYAGGKMVLVPRFDPAGVLGLMQEHGVDLFAGVPTMYFALLHHPDAASFDLSSLKMCLSGGAAMPVEVMRAFDAKYDVDILEGYGLSETSPVASFNTLERPKKPGSIGVPLDGVEFKLVDAEGATVEALGEAGEICIKGHNVMKGYFNKPEANAAAFSAGGWFHTGDIGVRDEDGFYSIVDRKKDMIIRGGFNVYPREVEEVLYAHPAVAEAAVIGVPDDRHGEEVKAVIAFKAGCSATEREIIAFCKEHVAAYKYPRIVEFLPELPKGGTGKILKRDLRR
jgi:long-chain acyl-CoA synthetase